MWIWCSGILWRPLSTQFLVENWMHLGPWEVIDLALVIFCRCAQKRGIRLALELLIKQENGRAPFSNPYKIYYTQSQATARP